MMAREHYIALIISFVCCLGTCIGMVEETEGISEASSSLESFEFSDAITTYDEYILATSMPTTTTSTFITVTIPAIADDTTVQPTSELHSEIAISPVISDLRTTNELGDIPMTATDFDIPTTAIYQTKPIQSNVPAETTIRPVPTSQRTVITDTTSTSTPMLRKIMPPTPVTTECVIKETTMPQTTLTPTRVIPTEGASVPITTVITTNTVPLIHTPTATTTTTTTTTTGQLNPSAILSPSIPTTVSQSYISTTTTTTPTRNTTLEQITQTTTTTTTQHSSPSTPSPSTSPLPLLSPSPIPITLPPYIEMKSVPITMAPIITKVPSTTTRLIGPSPTPKKYRSGRKKDRRNRKKKSKKTTTTTTTTTTPAPLPMSNNIPNDTDKDHLLNEAIPFASRFGH